MGLKEDTLRDEMQGFAIALSREVAVRGFGHKPDSAREKSWAKEGPVKPHNLDIIKEYCP